MFVYLLRVPLRSFEFFSLVLQCVFCLYLVSFPIIYFLLAVQRRILCNFFWKEETLPATIFWQYFYCISSPCSQSVLSQREMCEFMATLLLAPEGSAASSCWAIVQAVRFTRYWQWTSRDAQSLPVLLSQLNVTDRRISAWSLRVCGDLKKPVQCEFQSCVFPCRRRLISASNAKWLSRRNERSRSTLPIIWSVSPLNCFLCKCACVLVCACLAVCPSLLLLSYPYLLL